ncbi:hypothetical protein GTP45_18330 [Pseudoduganella sp. FT55W]|uniref:Restriction endonuclease n=1 Tax=Duganella rivi TaxID=2666083 RepID=A0A7X4GUB2_9BURK|nr:hypothetical protein [Duganella rivi]MYM68777.1 hypothetical protein [Duganella rivi]
MDIPHNFAVSLVSLALVRNGYRTYKDVPPGMGEEADILAVGNGEKFAVQVSVLKSHSAIPAQLERQRAACEAAFGTPTYFAFLADGETLLLVGAALHQRMRFRDNDVRLDEIPGHIKITSYCS